MHRRHLITSLGLALLAVALMACSPTAVPEPAAAKEGTGASETKAPAYLTPIPADQEVTIRFENYNLASAGIGRDATLQMLENFEKLHPNIKVETKATGSQEIFTSVQAQIVAGDPPDLAQLLLREWDLNVTNLEPVDLYEIVPPDELEEHLFGGEHPMIENGVKLTTRNGKLQGLPYVFSTPTLFYNATLFEEAGLDPDSPPKTWEEAAEMARQINEATGAGGIYIACIELDWCTQGLLYSNGASFMNEEQTQITFGEPEAIEVYRQWQQMVQEGAHVDMAGAEAQEAFQAGQLAMFLQTSAVQGRLLAAAEGNFTLRASAQPAWGDHPVVPVPSGSSVAILAKDPLKQRAAWELMKYLTGPEAYTIITRDIGYLPLRPSITEDPEYLGDWENLHIVRSNVEQMKEIRPTVAFPNNHLQIRKLFLETLERVLFHGEDPEAAFQEAQRRAQELLEG